MVNEKGMEIQFGAHRFQLNSTRGFAGAVNDYSAVRRTSNRYLFVTAIASVFLIGYSIIKSLGMVESSPIPVLEYCLSVLTSFTTINLAVDRYQKLKDKMNKLGAYAEELPKRLVDASETPSLKMTRDAAAAMLTLHYGYEGEKIKIPANPGAHRKIEGYLRRNYPDQFTTLICEFVLKNSLCRFVLKNSLCSFVLKNEEDKMTLRINRTDSNGRFFSTLHSFT